MTKLKHHTPYHIRRLTLLAFLVLACLFARIQTSVMLPVVNSDRDVLAYATTMSPTDLLAATNDARQRSGLQPLTLNQSLVTAAQLKAEDMTAHNYWSHVSPTGVQPWYWFGKVGYTYTAAGENLAYGFDSGQEVVTAWMDSPTHRDNILGNYREIGFGVANSVDFQGSDNTVVVAHYGTQRAAEPTVVASSTSLNSPDTHTLLVGTQPQTSNTQTSISALTSLARGQQPLAISIALVLVLGVGVGLVVTHRQFMRRTIARGEKLLIHHPLLDLVAVSFSTVMIVSVTVGYVL